MPEYRVKVSIFVEAYSREYTTLESSTTAFHIDVATAQQAYQMALRAVDGFAETVDAHEEKKRAEAVRNAS